MKKYLIVFLILGAGIMFVVYSCSMVGLGIGAAIDARKTRSIAGWEVFELPKDATITVYHKNGSSPVRGKFKGGAMANPALDTAVNVVLIEVPGKQIRDIPVSDINYIAVKQKTNTAKIIGFLVGLTADVTIVVVANEMSRWESNFMQPPDTGSSCPYFYSFDGTDYRLDAELFAGSFFKSAERPDWDNLDHLKPVNGVYRIKMTNELEETQYVDHLQLLAIDHPAGSRVYPSYGGKLFTLNEPKAPRTARDYAGANVLDRINTNDGEVWLSNPFGRDPQQPEDLRDGLTLEFDRPANTTSAALLLRVQNTAWNSSLLRNFLTLPGDQLDQWYAALEQSDEAHNAVHRAMIRETALRIHLWDGAQWRPSGHVWEVGTAIAKDVVAEIDLTGIPGNTLKLKLESTPGLWLVNSVQADFSYYTIPRNAQPVPVQKAVDQDGRDVTTLLHQADNRYYEMTRTGDAVDLEFMALPPGKGKERSFVLQGSGYYKVMMEPNGTPRMAEAQELIEKPGAFARFAVSTLNQEIAKYLRTTHVVQ